MPRPAGQPLADASRHDGAPPRAAVWAALPALGWPHRDQADIARAWQRIRGSVRDWTDLEPELIGRVEELIDFVTQPAD